MMFGRSLRGFIPSLELCSNLELEGARERGVLRKIKAGKRANIDRHAKETQMQPSDIFLRKNLNKGAIEPNFSAEEHRVGEVNGSEIKTTSSETRKEYVRNCTHLKKLEKGKNTEVEEDRKDTQKEEEEQKGRLKRTIRLPARFRED